METPVEITLDQLMMFQQLFSGNDSFYGETTFTGKTREDGKREVRCVTQTAPVLREHFKAHLEGRLGLGICPVTNDGFVRFGAIDIDSYGENTKELAKKLSGAGLPFCPCSSKSGGLHLFVFFPANTKAKEAVEVLNKIRLVLGLPPKTEIFPKQTKLTGKGNWINLPYFDAGNGTRLLWQAGEQIHELSRALTAFRDSIRTIKQWKEIFDNMELGDAPPCLQALYYYPSNSNRNIYLFNLATYYKAKGGDWKAEVLAANEQLIDPLTEEEIERTIFNSHDQHSYAYQCSQAPLCDRCDKRLCSQRKYGCASKDLPDIDYGQMTIVMSRPPTYFWEINGSKFQFVNAGELRKYAVFQEQCADQLGFFPHSMKQDKWLDILNQALTNAVKTEADAEELSSDYNIANAIKAQLMKCVFSDNMKVSLWGSEIHFDLRTKMLAFRFGDLMSKMNEGKAIGWQSSAVVDWLHNFGAKSDQAVDNGLKKAVWQVPAENIASKEEWCYELTKSAVHGGSQVWELLKDWLDESMWRNMMDSWNEVAAVRASGATSVMGYLSEGEEDI